MACGSLLRKPRRTLARSGPLRPASAGEKGLGEIQGAILGGCYCFRRHRLLAAHCRRPGKPPPPPRILHPRWLEPRFHVVLACFLATMTIYVERVGFSIAFTAMASKVTPQQSRGSARGQAPAGPGSRPDGWLAQPGFTHVPLPPAVQVGVEEGIKGAVLSAFYWGYAISQVMLCAGSIAHRLPPPCPSSTPPHVPPLRSRLKLALFLHAGRSAQTALPNPLLPP